MQSEPVTPAANSSQVVRPKTPDAKAVSSSSSSLGQCFGMGRTLDEEAEKEQMPIGVVGLRNLGMLHLPTLLSAEQRQTTHRTSQSGAMLMPYKVIAFSTSHYMQFAAFLDETSFALNSCSCVLAICTHCIR